MTALRLSFFTVAFLLAGFIVAGAYPTVSMTPSTSFVDVGEVFWVYLEVDGSGDSLACFQIEFTFDPCVIELIGAYEGELFYNSGYPTFFRWETDAPDTQRVLDCVMGVGTYVLGPGVIAELEFEALADGETTIDYLKVDLADVHRDDILDFETENALVFVGPTSADEIDGESLFDSSVKSESAVEIMAFPNPFLNETTIALYNPLRIPFPQLEVFDLHGRRVAAFDMGNGSSASSKVVWDGNDESGRPVPSGVYFARLSEAGAKTATAKLLRVR